MFIERRKNLRRQSDRDLLAKLEELQQLNPGGMSREQRHLQRKAIRHNCQASIALHIATNYGGSDIWTQSEHPIPGRLIDLSVDGCAVFSPKQLDIGDRLALSIALPKGVEIKCSGAVRWTKVMAEHKGYANGVQFTEISDENRRKIEAFLKKVSAEIGM